MATNITDVLIQMQAEKRAERQLQIEFENEKVFHREVLFEKYDFKHTPKYTVGLDGFAHPTKEFYDLCTQIDNYLHEPI